MKNETKSRRPRVVVRFQAPAILADQLTAAAERRFPNEPAPQSTALREAVAQWIAHDHPGDHPENQLPRQLALPRKGS